MTLTSSRRVNGNRPGSIPLGNPIEFVCRGGVYAGSGQRKREWRIKSVVTGWRLELRDPGDVASTYAGTYGSLDAAAREASSVHGQREHKRAG